MGLELKDCIRSINDFPKPGIIYRDITTLLRNKEAFNYAVNSMANEIDELDFDVIAAPEARGFIFASAIAYKLEKGLIPIRKKGKLPYETISCSYDLEYGSETIEMHSDAIKKGQRVVVIDDLLATGGTVGAIARLIENAGGEIALMSFLIELEELNGREALKGYNVSSIIKF